MASILSAHPADIKPAAAAARSMTAMPPTQEPTPPHQIKLEEEGDRGRPRGRPQDRDDGYDDHGDDGYDDHGDDGDDNAGDSPNSDDGPSRKRRRSRKGLDKKFECPAEGCGKSYSRAEHLYRHQLNHNPKQIYKCDFPDCTRKFVRLDLCNRHRDRHTAKGSALHRKDSLAGQVSPITDQQPPLVGAGSLSPEISRPLTGYHNGRPPHMQYHSPQDLSQSPYTPITNTPPTAYPGGAHAGAMDYMPSDPRYPHMQARQAPHHSPAGAQRPAGQNSVGPYGVLSPVSTQHGYHGQAGSTPQASAVYGPSQNFPPPPFTLPPSDFAATTSAGIARDGGQAYAPSSLEYSQAHPQTTGDMMLLDDISNQGTIPVFGSDTVLNKSPYVGMPEDFMAYLFNTQGAGASPIPGQMVQQPHPNYGEFGSQYGVAYEAGQMGYFPAAGPQQVMAVNNLLDQSPESVISEDKANELFDFIKARFHEKRGEMILEGERGNDEHMLSRKMMQAYIRSYWVHFSDQIPVLHQPTFSPDKTPNLLLIGIMIIGAACLDKTHGRRVTTAGAELSNFLASHLRWEVFMDPSFKPPAKLWVFQTLLLLEIYEKMYSTRELHERAHIHHATTITLMRRGRALIGKSALDSPPNPRSDGPGGGSRHSSTSAAAHTPDEWWNHWINNESTRRVAFAAFVIDSTHATMFGHSTVMVAHEMRLPLPCDEKLWKAGSGAEVGRIEANLMASGVKPVSFLEGLKRTLSNQEVQTNSFGRTVLMAGLLSVSWHMNQRDLQVSSLGGGITNSLGGRDKWRGTLTRAFDTWKGDFDKSLQQGRGGGRGSSGSAGGGGGAAAGGGGAGDDPYAYGEDNVIFESRTVLHHLAHMAMHVDIVEMQIFARAKRLLGRAIQPQDLSNAQRRMKDIWAPSAKARDAFYYALKFLCSVLLVDEAEAGAGAARGARGAPSPAEEPYSARDDFLLNRPWVLYFAALVVWCYGYALEGPCPGQAVPASRAEQVGQMRAYLLRFGGVSSPEELKARRGVNANSALLLVLKDAFEATRWELLHEGAMLLSNCIQLNTGAAV